MGKRNGSVVSPSSEELHGFSSKRLN